LSTFKFEYNSVIGGLNAAGLTGTYTYAPYSPVMALVTITPSGAGEPSQYLLLSYLSATIGDYVNATNNLGTWAFKSGTFSMK
jgi:hypothetical protein